MPESRYHTIIAGAGPTGLACAHVLAKAGKKVLIIEKKKLVGPKTCAGGITCSGISRYVPADLLERSFPTQKIYTPWQKVTIKSPVPLISTISRENLGKWMLARAVDAGAEHIQARVTGLGKNSITTQRETFHTDFLVGADGSNSTVRRLAGIPSEMSGIGINYFVPGDFPDMEWHLDECLFGNGYAWVFPHKTTTSVGAFISKNSISADGLKKNLHLWCKNRGINLGNSKLTAALINYDHRGYIFGNLFLAGDAAGLASPLTGEGIYPGIISGEEVAKTILDKNHDQTIIKRIVARHRSHLRIVELTARNRFICRLAAELAALGLRSGALPFSKIEMAS